MVGRLTNLYEYLTNNKNSQISNIMNFFQKNEEKGVSSIFLTLIVLGIITFIGVGLSAIFLNELKISSLIRQSASAFYAAETGAEYALLQANKKSPGSTGNYALTLTNGASFEVNWNPSSIQSVGKYASVRRKIEITW